MGVERKNLVAEEDVMNTAEVEDRVACLQETMTPLEELQSDADLKTEEKTESNTSMEHVLAIMRMRKKAFMEESSTAGRKKDQVAKQGRWMLIVLPPERFCSWNVEQRWRQQSRCHLKSRLMC